MRTWGRALARRRRALHAEPEAGASLVELVAGMALMAVFGAMFTGAVVMVTRTTGKVQATSEASSSLTQAHLGLDRIVRYASAVSAPGTSPASGNWYVELRESRGGTELCTQLWIDRVQQSLWKRSWRPSDPAAAVTRTQLAPGITNGSAAAGSADQPFVLATPAGNARHQRLTVTLTTRSASGSRRSSSR